MSSNEDSKNKEELLRENESLKQRIEKLKSRKKYGLVWEEKDEDVALKCSKNLPVITEIQDKALNNNKEDQDHLIIEGDNYHALTVLNYTHREEVDVIYIDPPYNTGKSGEWKYNDKYVDENDGYKHSKWLSFMGKRLELARNLLKSSGLIFISIDDHEAAQLKLLCDQIFGSDNFIAQLVWENKEGGGRSDSKFFRMKHEYILCYAKDSDFCKIKGEKQREDRSYNYKDEHYERRGAYKLIKLNSFSINYSDSLDYEIELPNEKVVTPSESGKRGCWRWSKDKYKWGLENDFIEFKENRDGKLWVYTKQYFKVDEDNQPIDRMIPYRGVISKFSSTLATKQLEKIFGDKPFDYPKPYQLIKFLIKLYDANNSKEATILDFFAGSGTTGQAVLDLNEEDDGDRNFILCTNNEVSAGEEKGFKNKYNLDNNQFEEWVEQEKEEWLSFQEEHGICSAVCYPRIKKVIEGYEYEGKREELVWEKGFTLNTLRWGKANEVYQNYEKERKKVKENYDDYESSFKDNTIRLYGVNEVEETTEGLGGNLKYYETSFVNANGINSVSDSKKLELSYKAGSMIAVRENTLELRTESEWWQLFEDKQEKRLTGIYFRENKSQLHNFVKKLSNLDEPTALYIFSWGTNEYKNEFREYDSIQIKNIPQPILEVFKEINRSWQ